LPLAPALRPAGAEIGKVLEGAFKLVLRERIENVDPSAEVLQIKET